MRYTPPDPARLLARLHAAFAPVPPGWGLAFLAGAGWITVLQLTFWPSPAQAVSPSRGALIGFALLFNVVGTGGLLALARGARRAGLLASGAGAVLCCGLGLYYLLLVVTALVSFLFLLLAAMLSSALLEASSGWQRRRARGADDDD